LAFIEKQSGNRKKGLIYGNKSLEIRRSIGDKKGQAELLLFLAELTVELQEPEMETECFRLLEKAFLLAEETKALDLLAKVRFSFYQLNKRHNRFEEALLHLEKYNSLEKELHRDALNQKIINIEISHNAEQARKEAEIFQLRNVELAALYEESKAQKVVIENQKKLVEESLIQLKETQNQLIQKEKMASLGELTAGIAHEIQNPLNFVINFSELSIELAEEIKQALMNGREGKAIELENDLKQNLGKINYHGKRADSIVKNMLQHSRKNSGQFELTDIHILIEEYLRLAFQGMRTKERNFNVSVQTYFDNHLEKINIMPQEIGRVLVNLLNNAFYSVIKKRQQLSDQYVPEIILTTRRLSKALEISVKDNGLGIPHQALEKIFQPFFTTKPAGEGVGLGLSLSYDIITKGHGGEFFVETKEGDYAEFVIRLPLKASV
jgi:signal transduction histidine kinase